MLAPRYLFYRVAERANSLESLIEVFGKEDKKHTFLSSRDVFEEISKNAVIGTVLQKVFLEQSKHQTRRLRLTYQDITHYSHLSARNAEKT